MEEKKRQRQKPDYSYINRYNDEHYDKVIIVLPKGAKERIKMAAKARGQSMTEYLISFIPHKITGVYREIKE